MIDESGITETTDPLIENEEKRNKIRDERGLFLPGHEKLEGQGRPAGLRNKNTLLGEQVLGMLLEIAREALKGAQPDAVEAIKKKLGHADKHLPAILTALTRMCPEAREDVKSRTVNQFTAININVD